MKRKILSLILVFAMTVSLLTVGTGAVEPTYGDTAGHWAESSIERWSAYGIIQGSNGQFDPNGQLTCAQLATILAKLLKLPAAKDAGFTDNTADAWYYDAINRCAAAGILNGNGDGTVTPEAPITRERAMVMLARALGIEPIRKPDLTKYTDAAQVSAYAQGYVAALIEAGIVGGVTADELVPQDNINRASTVTILDRAISTYADQAGATVKADGKGLVLVVAKNVKITGAPEGTKIVVADGATGLTVNGKSVSDDQTYIVPKTTTGSGSSSGGGHSHSYVYTDNGDGTHTGKCYANDSALSPEAHNHNGENGKCTVCGAAQTAASVASVKAADGTYTYYTTLAAALAAAKNGDTVKLVQDITPTDRIEVTGDKNITIDLAEKKITSTADAAIVNNGTGKLTITGNGTVDTSSSTNGENIAIWARTGSIDIENGTFINKSNKEATVYAGTSADTSTPVITIKGGTFKNSAEGTYTYNSSLKPLTLNVQNGKPVTSIVITGGTFVGQNPGDGDDNKGGTFLAPDYKSVETSSGVWTVEKKNWDDYDADGTTMPAGVKITSRDNNGNVTVTLEDEDAFKYFTQKFDMDAACSARKTALDNGATRYPGESVHNHLNIWYRAYHQVHVEMAKSVNLGGMEVTPFTEYSTFDGKGFTISDAKVSGTDTSVGFFGGNPITNVKMDSISVTANDTQYAGVISGFNSSSITNVTVTRSTVTGGKNTGAIVGNCYVDLSGCTVENCTISGQYKVGGLAGYVCREDGQKRIISNNTLRNVTLKGENRISGKSDFVIGQAIGNWNARSGGSINVTTIENVTGADSLIGKIESDVATPSIDGKVQVGSQEALANAISSTTAGEETSIKLAAGTYTLPSLESKSITISGTKDTVIDMANKLNNGASNISFEGVTVKFGTDDYKGFQHTGKLTYKDCTITGKQFLYGTKVEFINCNFMQDVVDYNVWTYGAGTVLFKDCKFNCKGKSVLIYNEGALEAQTVEFQNCSFNASGKADGKAAIEIDSRFTSYTVTIDQATANNVIGFANGSVSNNSLWNVKAHTKPVTVTVDSTVMYNQ